MRSVNGHITALRWSCVALLLCTFGTSCQRWKQRLDYRHYPPMDPTAEWLTSPYHGYETTVWGSWPTDCESVPGESVTPHSQYPLEMLPPDPASGGQLPGPDASRGPSLGPVMPAVEPTSQMPVGTDQASHWARVSTFIAASPEPATTIIDFASAPWDDELPPKTVTRLESRGATMTEYSPFQVPCPEPDIAGPSSSAPTKPITWHEIPLPEATALQLIVDGDVFPPIMISDDEQPNDRVQ